MSHTRRQRIAELLREGRWTVEELAGRLGTPVKAVLDDLEHVRRSLQPPERWVIHQAECQTCGFVFRRRERLNRPSRCPSCKSEFIDDPQFEIVSA